MKELLNKVKRWVTPSTRKRKLIYRNAKGDTKLYVIDEPDMHNRFGNLKEQRQEVGFTVRCHNRGADAIRSFRNDRVVAIM